MLLLILVVLSVFAVVGAGVGHSRYGYLGWSPAAVILLVFGVLYLTGALQAR